MIELFHHQSSFFMPNISGEIQTQFTRNGGSLETLKIDGFSTNVWMYLLNVKIPRLFFCVIRNFKVWSRVGLNRFTAFPEHEMGRKCNNLIVDRFTESC